MAIDSQEAHGSNSRNNLFEITNWILLIAGIFNLLIGALYAIKGEAAKSSGLSTIALLLLLAATIDRFESVKGLGIEAKTKKLDKKIEQANEILGQLKNLAEVTGASLVNITSKVGRWGAGISSRESYSLAQKIRHILISIDSERSSIEESLRPWVKISCFDMARVITNPITTECNEELRRLHQQNQTKVPIDPQNTEYLAYLEQSKILNTYNDKLNNLFELSVDDYPDKIEQLIREAPIENKEIIDTALNKIKHFSPMFREIKENFYLSNPELWLTEFETNKKY